MVTPVKSMKSPLKMGTYSASTEFPMGEEMLGAQVQDVSLLIRRTEYDQNFVLAIL